jgi:hypothetical protein
VRSRLPFLLIMLVVVLASLMPSRAAAALDPNKAEADVHAILESGDYTFCAKPDDPLSPRARELCPLAGEIPGCSALVLACEKTVPELPKPSPFWEKVIAFLAKVAPIAAWAIVGALVLFVLYLIVRAVRAASEDSVDIVAASKQDVTVLEDAPVPEDTSAALALLRLAAEARARGDSRTALFTYLAAALRALGERGAIRIARDRTNGEYVRMCQEALARAPLREIVRAVDGVQFGGDEATEGAVTVAATRAEAIVRGGTTGLPPGVTAALMAIGFVLFLGACKGPLGGGHDDPAGRDLLVELLTREGAVISSLPGSLASLPLEGASGPVVILDAERVPLEEETRDHLVAWVKQGGMLVIAGPPALWPKAFWAKRTGDDSISGLTTVKVETRDAIAALAAQLDDDDDDDDAPPRTPPPAELRHAKLARSAAMTWPNDDRAPRAIAHLDSGELYGALRVFGDGRVLGLASADLLSNVGLAVPGNAAAIVAMLATLDRHEFAIARAEQGVAPPSNPFAGLVHIGLGPALAHVALFIPLLFLAYGVRQTAPRAEPPPRRQAFAEHVQAVGALYARRRAATHALAVYAKHVDDRVRAAMPRGNDPAQFLAARSGADPATAAELYARALAAESGAKPLGDELRVLQRLSVLYAKAIARK